MSMTVRVQARAWGAIVTVAKTTQGEEGHITEDHEEHVLGANEDRVFHVEPGYSVTAVHGKEPTAEEETAETVSAEDPAASGKRKGFKSPADNESATDTQI